MPRKDYSKRKYEPYSKKAHPKYDKTEDSAGVIFNTNQCPHKLYHVIFVGGRFHDENGVVDDVDGYLKACRELVSTMGRFTKSNIDCVHVDDCENLFQYCNNRNSVLHYHALVLIRCDRNTKKPLMDDAWRKRHYFRHLGNQQYNCKECDINGSKGKSAKCPTCDCFCVFRPIRNSEHALATKEYIKRRHAQYTGELYESPDVPEDIQEHSRCTIEHSSERERQQCDACYRDTCNDMDQQQEQEKPVPSPTTELFLESQGSQPVPGRDFDEEEDGQSLQFSDNEIPESSQQPRYNTRKR